ncbi:MAG: hypothetical protein M3299_07235 [Thermoproteota archaeon]|nr:hypothetical protein [Thermoproteota archaeon]
MLLLSILFMMAINPVSLRAEGQLSPYREKSMLDNTIFFLLDEVEYTFDIYGAQIFPNEELKYSILTERNHSVYSISRLSFPIMDHTINASDVQIHVQPAAMLDDTKTRLDIQIYAATADVTGQWMSKKYNNLEIRSLYAIYDRTLTKWSFMFHIVLFSPF